MNAPGTDNPRLAPSHAGRRQARRLSLQHVHRPVGRARDFTRQTLTDWGWGSDCAGPADEPFEDVLLVVSELVANAGAHAGGATELALGIDEDKLTVSVADPSDRLPRPRHHSEPSQPGGHGLNIVALLAASWGTATRPDGKTVWAIFHNPPGGSQGCGR